MVSTVRFPSSKQPRNKLLLLVIIINLALLAWLQAKFFALFFVFYVSGTLLLNIAWQQGWRGVAPPEIFED
jgi:CDP-diacylglycerol--serine O-phosphatidyltransferase